MNGRPGGAIFRLCAAAVPMRNRSSPGMKLEDVAPKAGVGKATVSRVLNNQPGVKKSTRTKILRAMEELNYHPNLHASTLAKGKNHTLGVILSNLYNLFFLTFLTPWKNVRCMMDMR